MNEIWGPENPAIVWHWLIAVYLFLVGLSSGAMITALSVEWMNPQKKLLGMRLREQEFLLHL
ncbi:NrfD/PsrC family molybdoenzyme membrane anchor subunit [Helicobacter sp. 11-8110]|uniref:NrfD/PsrC family molybdoenzyme membrane anchor subunit n=1 Tax=Helicobacter sp. 11-8110 TaxID=2004997 RepID=UPI00215C4309|nr:NrfD/PsrC family molybdoenzyme membrane anchor subunit [Helicobacter sp. 11-8110]